MLAEPEAVVQHLRDLGLDEVYRVGAKGDVPDGVLLVFLDYDLESNQGAQQQVGRRSQQIAEELSKRDNGAPFLVLFSSKPEVQELADSFREESGYLRGTFAFISKERARDAAQLRQLLFGYCLGHPALQLTQRFFFALKKHLRIVAESVRQEVMQLDVQDYAFIQRLGLQEDGAPLGEYLLDLFGSVLSHEMRNSEEVQQARRALDALDFDKGHLPFADQPSAPIQRLYRAMLTDAGVGPVSPHPQSGAAQCKNAAGENCAFPPLLMLGDIFARSVDHPIHVVVNPACSLQYSPKNPKRQPDFSRSVYLLPGHLESLTAPVKDTGRKRMEWLEFEGRSWRVLWDDEQVETVPLGRFETWRQEKGCERIARLSLPHALALQQFWTSQLSRVGLPVNLPFFDACDLHVFLPTEGGEWQKSELVARRQAIMSRQPRDSKEYSHFTLTRDGRNFLHQQLTAATAVLATQDRLNAARQTLGDWRFWTNLVEVPRKLNVQKGALDKSTPTVVFAWETIPKLADLKKQLQGDAAQGAADRVALIVVLQASQ